MTKSISEDLRSRVIAAVDGGLSRRAAAERFGIAVASAVRWVREWQETGSTRAKPQGGDMRSRRIEAYHDFILGAIEAQVNITLVELAELLRSELWCRVRPEHGLALSRSPLDDRQKKRRTPASRSGPTFSRGGAPGSRLSLISILSGWYLSMRPAHRRKWRACEDGPRAARGVDRPSHMGTGKRPPSQARCA